MPLSPDRLLPPDPQTRAIARRLYDSVRELPIISPHGHVPADWIADDVAFTDPTSLLISPDHYVTRLLHSAGVGLDELGVGQSGMTEAASRRAFALLCEHWSLYRGTPVRSWLEQEFEIFGVEQMPSPDTAEASYDQIADWIAQPTSRPRALLTQFGIEVMATTDDPCDDLAAHRRIADDAEVRTRVLPTFRPDAYLESARPEWNDLVDRLGDTAGVDTDRYAGWVQAMEIRRAYFADHGAVSTDHAHLDLGTETLAEDEVERCYTEARRGTISAIDGARLRRHMVAEMVRMACEDGLTMTLHPGVYRNHHTPSRQRFGTDVGADIPVGVEVTQALRPVLNRFGTHPNLNLVLFTCDESVYSREIAPLAGFYPSVYVGVPWWFLDAPEAIRRFQRSVTETAGFSRLSGFIDDTRAFCSIPARHDLARRLDAGHLAGLVAEHRLEEDEAAEVARQLVVDQPRKVFKL